MQGGVRRSLADACESEFRADVRGRGRSYFLEKRVTLVDPTPSGVCALVDGNADNYALFVTWSEAQSGVLGASCTCPYFDEHGCCKHLWATLLAIDAQGMTPPQMRAHLAILPADDGDYDGDDDHDEFAYDEDEEPPPPPRAGQHSTAPQRGRRSQPSWRMEIDAILEQQQQATGAPSPLAPVLRHKVREAWYVLNVPATINDSLLVIDFFCRDSLKSGGFGGLKPANISRRDLDRFTLPEDRQMLELLLGGDAESEGPSSRYGSRYSYYGGYEPRVSSVSMPILPSIAWLPRLCATGRFLWAQDDDLSAAEVDARPLAWDDGPAWRFHLRIDADDEQNCWRFGGELLRDGGGDPIDVKTPPLLTAAGVGLVEDRLARFEAGDCFAWVAALRKGLPLEVPYADRWELLRRLGRSSAADGVALPANLRCEEVRLPPQGHLIVHPPAGAWREQLPADVAFLYGEQSVTAADPGQAIVDEAAQRLIVRDRQQELQLLKDLAGSGAQPPDRSYYNTPAHDMQIPRAKLPGLVAALVTAGWRVDAEGVQLRKPGEFRFSVSSGVDWFDLEGACDFDGQVVPLPQLLEALHDGKRFVQLGDGSQGLLPEEWLKRIAALVELGEAKGDQIRFRPSQALLLDAFLAERQHAEQVSVDQQFAHVRQQLRSFDGVAPHAQPPGFVGQLRHYQEAGLGWLTFLRDFRLGGCLADDMGLGKTVQVLALLEAQRTQRPSGAPRASLVVVPRSLVFNWIEEAQRFTPKLKILDYTGLLRKSALERIDGCDLVVTTYGTLVRDIAALKKVPFRYAILDEAQAIKNSQSQRAKACRLLKAEHRLVMTGTPVENHLGELWSLFEFLNPGMLGRSAAFQAFSRANVQDRDDLALLRRALKPFLLRRTKEQVLSELPEKTEQTLYCDLEGSQRAQYDQLREYYRKSLLARINQGGLAKAKIHVLEALLRLRQAACHPGLIDKRHASEPSAKLDALLEQLNEVIDEGHKALVFSQFTSLLALVRERLDNNKIVYEYLDGRTRNRQARVERFQTDAACPVFLISLKAGGQGLNLTAADYVFVLDPWWNPAVEAQAIDRAHRIGQTRRVFAYRRLDRDTVEDKIVEMQKSKRELAEAIVAADESVIRNLTADDLQLLLS